MAQACVNSLLSTFTTFVPSCIPGPDEINNTCLCDSPGFGNWYLYTLCNNCNQFGSPVPGPVSLLASMCPGLPDSISGSVDNCECYVNGGTTCAPIAAATSSLSANPTSSQSSPGPQSTAVSITSSTMEPSATESSQLSQSVPLTPTSTLTVFMSTLSDTLTSPSTSIPLSTTLLTVPTSISSTSNSSQASTSSAPAVVAFGSNNGLSTGAKVGIGLGAAAGALILVAILIFLFSRRQRSRLANQGAQLEGEPVVAMSQNSSGSNVFYGGAAEYNGRSGTDGRGIVEGGSAGRASQGLTSHPPDNTPGNPPGNTQEDVDAFGVIPADRGRQVSFTDGHRIVTYLSPPRGGQSEDPMEPRYEAYNPAAGPYPSLYAGASNESREHDIVASRFGTSARDRDINREIEVDGEWAHNPYGLSGSSPTHGSRESSIIDNQFEAAPRDIATAPDLYPVMGANAPWESRESILLASRDVESTRNGDRDSTLDYDTAVNALHSMPSEVPQADATAPSSWLDVEWGDAERGAGRGHSLSDSLYPPERTRLGSMGAASNLDLGQEHMTAEELARLDEDERRIDEAIEWQERLGSLQVEDERSIDMTSVGGSSRRNNRISRVTTDET